MVIFEPYELAAHTTHCSYTLCLALVSIGRSTIAKNAAKKRAALA